jgi:hypothetical protein
MQATHRLEFQSTQKMEDLTQRSQREAVAMRIITVVTLIYLPATFVSVSALITYMHIADTNSMIFSI